MVATNSPSSEVDAGRQRRQGAGEGDVAERVAGEDLAAQHEEVADQARGRGDQGPGQKGVRMNGWLKIPPTPTSAAADTASATVMPRHRALAAAA